MKKRTGFVSNSSSSSFIMGVGVIKDYNKFNKWVETNNLTHIQRYNNLEELKKIYWINIGTNNDKVSISSFTYDSVVVDLEQANKMLYDNIDNDDEKIVDRAKNMLLDQEMTICLFYNTGPDGDNAFMDDYGDIDYDVDLSDFNDIDIKAYNGFINEKESGIILGDVAFGAGRDG